MIVNWLHELRHRVPLGNNFAVAPHVANHETRRTTKLYGQRQIRLTEWSRLRFCIIVYST